MDSVHVASHPLVAHHLTALRDRTTSPAEFRRLVHRLSTLLLHEATSDLPLVASQVETPLERTTGARITARIGLVPILRAGLGMVDAALDVLPAAEVWHLGLYRDESTAEPVSYYNKLPPGRAVDVGLILDPMLATGGSAALACQELSDWGVPRIKMVGLIAAPEGIAHLRQACPEVTIHVGVVDSHLNDRKFIVPGLGDAGDRTFNTEG